MAFTSLTGELVYGVSAGSIALWCIAGLFTYWLFLVIYRLTLHPLARYPGRFIDKITSWPHVYQCWKGTRYMRLHEIHKKYGHVVRIGPNWLDFDTATAQQTIHRDRTTNCGKGDWYTMEPTISGEMSLQTTRDKKQHDIRRRILGPAFSETALRNHEEFIIDNTNNFLATIAEKNATIDEDGWTDTIDYSEWVTYYSLDFIADLAFGSSLSMLDEASNRYIPKMLQDTNFFINYIGYLPFPNLIRKLVSYGLMQYIDTTAAEAAAFAELSTMKLEQRQSLEEKSLVRNDIFHYLINSKDPETGKGFSQNELVADSLLLLAAGSDGVSHTLSAAVFYLLRNPETLEKLTVEIRSMFSSYEDIRGTKLKQCAYLDGVVNEALRLSPAVPDGLPRVVLPGGINVDGRHIPEGMVLYVSPYQVHHNEDIFHDSFKFMPERWMESENKNARALKSALCTFGAGRFDCIGKNIAYVATRQALARMVWKYDVRAANGTLTGGGAPHLEKGRQREDEFQMIDYAMAYRNGPHVQMRARTV